MATYTCTMYTAAENLNLRTLKLHEGPTVTLLTTLASRIMFFYSTHGPSFIFPSCRDLVVAAVGSKAACTLVVMATGKDTPTNRTAKLLVTES